MELCKLLLPEFDNEMAGTRKVLERLSDDLLEWKLNEKSNTIGWVANHLANLPNWLIYTLKQSKLDLMPVDGEPWHMPESKTVVGILEIFDRNVKEAHELLTQTTNDELMQPWSLLKTGEIIFTLPKYNVIRTWVINHTIHHRGNLCAYCRHNKVPVPALYGPSADE